MSQASSPRARSASPAKTATKQQSPRKNQQANNEIKQLFFDLFAPPPKKIPQGDPKNKEALERLSKPKYVTPKLSELIKQEEAAKKGKGAPSDKKEGEEEKPQKTPEEIEEHKKSMQRLFAKPKTLEALENEKKKLEEEEKERQKARERILREAERIRNGEDVQPPDWVNKRYPQPKTTTTLLKQIEDEENRWKKSLGVGERRPGNTIKISTKQSSPKKEKKEPAEEKPQSPTNASSSSSLSENKESENSVNAATEEKKTEDSKPNESASSSEEPTSPKVSSESATAAPTSENPAPSSDPIPSSS